MKPCSFLAATILVLACHPTAHAQDFQKLADATPWAFSPEKASVFDSYTRFPMAVAQLGTNPSKAKKLAHEDNTLPPQPRTIPEAISSKAVVQNGLQVTTTLPRATFVADEPLKFTVQFKNVSDKAFPIYDADYFWDWRITFEDQQKIGPWRFNKLFKHQRIRPESKMLKPGESLDVPVALDHDKSGIEFAWEGLQKKDVEPVKSLPPGKYELAIEIKLQANPNDVLGGKRRLDLDLLSP